MADVIDAWCIACPDGTALWCKDEPKDAAALWANWRNSLPATQREKYEQAGVLGGIVKARMLRSDFDRARGVASVDADRVQRLRDAIEGECDGLAIDEHHARAILQYVDGVKEKDRG